MSHDAPDELTRLLDSALRSGATGRDDAWTTFLARYGGYVIHVARSCDRDHDVVMDFYAFAIEQLQRDGYARLRSYVAVPR